MSTKKTQSDKFINIPRDWVYLIGYKYPVINRYGEPKLNKNKEQITRSIDYVDLLLMDEIRGFKERGNKECFKEANSLAESVGMYGNERIICDKVLQLCNLGFIRAYRKIDDKQRIPRIVLETNTDVVNSIATSVKEQIESEKRIHSQHGDFLSLLKENNMLQEYLQEYLQEDLQEPLPEYLSEQLPEHLQEPLQEDAQDHLPEYPQEDLQDQLQEELPEPLQDNSQEHLQAELRRLTDTSKHDDDFPFDDPEDEYWPDIDETILSQNGSAISDQHINESSISCFDGSPAFENEYAFDDKAGYENYYILDGKTDAEIVAESRRRIRVLSDTLKGKYFDYLIQDTICDNRKYESHIEEDISKALSDATKEDLSKEDINNLVKIVNYMSSSFLSDKHLRQYANGDLQLKPMERKEDIYEIPF